MTDNEKDRYIHVRDYNGMDWPSVLGMVTDFQQVMSDIDADPTHAPFGSRERASRYLTRLLADIEPMNGRFLVAEMMSDDRQLVGFVSGVIDDHSRPDDFYDMTHRAEDDGWVGVLYVKPEFRSHGVGKLLLSVLKKHFVKHKVFMMRILVLNDNKGAIRLYESLGFEPYEVKMRLRLDDLHEEDG